MPQIFMNTYDIFFINRNSYDIYLKYNDIQMKF